MAASPAPTAARRPANRALTIILTAAVGALISSAGSAWLTITMRYASKAVRDAVLQSPMEHGVAASFDLLEGLVVKTA